ncbi:MAG: ymdB [Gemmatimonadetes bacterium]|nr:ymdB [Gemmatimonadota bacterium]
MIEVVRTDITTLEVDAIVNAANAALRGGGGVDGAIHRAAGPDLLRECRRHPGCPPGTAVLTQGYRLPARFVIHTVGPVWQGGRAGEAAVLESAYRSVFRTALNEGSIRTIAFPAISTGVYGFPRLEAATIAVQVMREFEPAFDRILVAAFDPETEACYRLRLAEPGGGRSS